MRQLHYLRMSESIILGPLHRYCIVGGTIYGILCVWDRGHCSVSQHFWERPLLPPPLRKLAETEVIVVAVDVEIRRAPLEQLPFETNSLLRNGEIDARKAIRDSQTFSKPPGISP